MRFFIILCSLLLVSIVSSSQNYKEGNVADEESLGYQERDMPIQVPAEPRVADPSLLQKALEKEISGIFYSGGGYVSHGEGLVLTWGWFHLLKGLSPTAKTSLADMFSNKIVSTNSGGGWFFNELLYCEEWNTAVATADATDMVKKAIKYYYDVIAHVYDTTPEDIEEKTKSGRYNALSKGDYATLYYKMHSWQELVEKHHYFYKNEPVMNVQNLQWRSQIAINQDDGYGSDISHYHMSSNRKVFTESERHTWKTGTDGYPAIPAQYVFDFGTSSNKPEITLDIPVFDDWWGGMCSIRKTTKSCSKPADCTENAFCDTDVGYCFCEAGFQAQGETCKDCSADTTLVGSNQEYTTTTTIHLQTKKCECGWFGTNCNCDSAKGVPIKDLKEVIIQSISGSSKLYSGPSSAAVAAMGSTLATLASVAGFESAWKTPQMSIGIKSSIGLVDGVSVDNCGLIGLVRHYQSTLSKPDMNVWNVASNIDETLLGMCGLDDMSLLTTNMNIDGTMGSKERANVLFPIFTLEEAPKLVFEGDVLEVWSTKVKTLYEPVNGILPGSSFSVFLFFYPQDIPRETRGVCRNMGVGSLGSGKMDAYGNCEYNGGKTPENQNPLLSLLLGKGETFEIEISLTAAVKDMQALADTLSNLASGQDAIGENYKGTSVGVAEAVNVIRTRLGDRFLAFGGVSVLVAFLFLRSRKQAQEDSAYTALMNEPDQEI